MSPCLTGGLGSATAQNLSLPTFVIFIPALNRATFWESLAQAKQTDRLGFLHSCFCLTMSHTKFHVFVDVCMFLHLFKRFSPASSFLKYLQQPGQGQAKPETANSVQVSLRVCFSRKLDSEREP